MTAESAGDVAQIRRIAEQLAPIYADRPIKPELPAPLKWAAGIIGAIMTAGSLTLAIWLVSTVNQMQVTLARMDERAAMNSQNLTDKFKSLDERLARLEAQKEARR